MTHDTLIRNGTVIDGTGAEPFVADVAIDDGVIAGIGPGTGAAREVIDATDCLVTPGFVDIHTHYDGQAIWSEHLSPSSLHGVTTVVAGNCGVGFAPCRPADHDLLVDAMQGVEDIPEAVMVEGLPWDWQTFPAFLDALESRRRDIDIAVYLPHSPLRVYAMGERGASREPATDSDIALMAKLAREAVEAGAVGFATSRIAFHRRGDGEHIPSFGADEAELLGIGGAVAGRGVIQVVTALANLPGLPPLQGEVDLLARLSRSSASTVTFTAVQPNGAPDGLDEIMAAVAAANTDPAVRLRPQFAPRAIGIHVGFALSAHPFSACPTYRPLAELPFAERLEALRRSEVRQRIVSEEPDSHAAPIVLAARNFAYSFPVSEQPGYEPAAEDSVLAQAARAGISPAELAYDAMLREDGRAMLYVAMSNYARNNLDHVAGLFDDADAVIGLGDGGAHYGMIADSSYPTFVLSHWARDRDRGRTDLAAAVRSLTAVPAEVVGFADRGRLAAGYRADVNVIHHESLRLTPVRTRNDLPSGGQRLFQGARGYRHTFVSGVEIARGDAYTGRLPGRLVRGRTSVPA
jgi:N-acyl-D-aspartate/D-glutamate deacylase